MSDESGTLVVVQPYDAAYQVVAYPPHDKDAGWSDLVREDGLKVRYRNTSHSQTLYASYLSGPMKVGRYKVEVFIPSTHATTKSAQYHINYYQDGETREKIVVVDQSKYFDEWVLLGEFPIDTNQDPLSGRVNLIDLTQDPGIKEIAFSPIRWRPKPAVEVGPGGLGQRSQNKKAMVQPNQEGYEVVAYPPHDKDAGWSDLARDDGLVIRYRKTSSTQTLYASYIPASLVAGRYKIEVFIPGTHATTRSAQYHVRYFEQGQVNEKVVEVNQMDYSDTWVSLGEFNLNSKQDPLSGRVNLLDLTHDSVTREIAFGPIRWRPYSAREAGFDSPVGTIEERTGTKIWPGRWVDANPYGTHYSLGQDKMAFHTGADLNLPNNEDRGKPVYAIANGIITHSAVHPESWNGLIVIDHGRLPDGSKVFARYAHVENINVEVGDAVTRGQKIATIGLFGPAQFLNYHLHFDVAVSKPGKLNILEFSPRDWPGENLNKVKQFYTDPKDFLKTHRPG